MAQKAWKDLSPEYKARLKRHGITARNRNTKASKAKISAIRGHAATPERPERAVKNPQRYSTYLQNVTSIQNQVIAKKNAIWGSTFKYRNKRADRNVHTNPRTNRPPELALMKKFLALNMDDIADIDWRDDDWAFLFYH